MNSVSIFCRSILERELAEKIFTYVKGNVTIDGVLIENVGNRKKGLIGSLSAERPSLKIKFSEYVGEFGMGE